MLLSSDHVYLMKEARGMEEKTGLMQYVYQFLPLLFFVGYEEDRDGVGALDLEGNMGGQRPSIRPRVSIQVCKKADTTK